MRAGSRANKVRLWRARGVTERACTRDKKGVLVVGEEMLATTSVQIAGLEFSAWTDVGEVSCLGLDGIAYT